tara:strand:+ start:379 stop:888 length:510 start_codon:yes stop_codon:yes gene_type:complete
MSKGISEFGIWLDEGFVKPSLYSVSIVSSVLNEPDLMSDTITLPGRNLSTLQRRTFGPQRDIPYERLFSGDLDIGFVFKEKDSIRYKLEEWMDLIIDPKSNQLNPDYFGYVGSITIKLESSFSSLLSTFEMEIREVYPKTINPIQLGYNITNDYVRQTVSFAFRDYTIS